MQNFALKSPFYHLILGYKNAVVANYTFAVFQDRKIYPITYNSCLLRQEAKTKTNKKDENCTQN